MTTYKKIIDTLIKEERVTEFYRFQGSNSFEYFNIKSNKFDNNKHYIYISGTKNHHYYFTIRRIRQLLNKVVLNNTPYNISNRELENEESFKKIVNIVLNQENIKNLKSISLIIDNTYYQLLKENSVYNMAKKESSNLIERVDRKIYKGGYGVSNAWLDLLNDLTFFSSYIRITSIDILNILKNMRREKKLTSPYLISNILDSKERVYRLSDNLYNDFQKYNIMNDLETIYEEKLYFEGSSFGSNPSKNIKNILTSYQKNREKVLRLVENSYHKY